MLFNIHNMLKSKQGKTQIKETLKYIFTEVPENHIDIMMSGILIYSLNQNPVVNSVYLAWIMSIYASVSKEQKQYPMTHDEFLNNKAEKLASVIKSSNPKLKMASTEKVNKIKALKMLDIGAGDCHMTQRVGVKLNAKPTPIDLAGSNKEMWKGHVAEVSKGPEVIYYDGVNLISAVEQDTNGFQSLYDVVTFNHVLHHYPNRDAQIQGLQRTVALMKEGGVILFSEHASILADEQIELQHVLFDLKDATNKVMGQNPALAFELLGTLSDETHLKYEKEKGRATYFSRPLLERLTKVCGLTPIVSKTRTNEGDYDASHTVITGFIKTSPTMTPEEVKFFQPKTLAQLTDNGELKAFEDTDACGFKLSNTEQGKFFQSSKSIQPSHASVDSNGFYYLSTKL